MTINPNVVAIASPRLKVVLPGEDGESMPSGPLPDGAEKNGGVSDPSVLDEFQQLIQRGHEVLYSCGWNGTRYTAFKPGGIEVLKFRARTLGLIRRAFGQDHHYHLALTACVDHRDLVEKGYFVKEFLDVLEQAYREYLRDRLFNISDSLLLKLSDNLIELAEAMSNAGCYLPAASQAGEVLEELLRTMGRSRAVPHADEMSGDELNDSLFGAKAYGESTHRKISACLQIARDIVGGRGLCIHEPELAEMVQWVRDFAMLHRQAGSGADQLK